MHIRSASATRIGSHCLAEDMRDVTSEQALLLMTRSQQGADAARGPQAGEALRVHRSNPLGRRARGPAWPLEVGDDELLPAHCDAGMVLEVLEFLEVRCHRLAG